jgi:hypothetical protein
MMGRRFLNSLGPDWTARVWLLVFLAYLAGLIALALGSIGEASMYSWGWKP